MPVIVTRIVDAMVRDQTAVQEQALEAAVQGGLYGVSTVHNGLRCSSMVDPRVPYGQHFTFPSPASYNAWLEQGAPTA